MSSTKKEPASVGDKKQGTKGCSDHIHAASSSISILIPIMSIAIAVLAPLITLGLFSFDASRVCSLAPSLCENLYLARPVNDDTTTSEVYSMTISLEFFNRLGIPVDTYWKDYAGDEQFWFTMEPYSYTGNISSIRGHVWSFRSSETSALLFEEAIDIGHCGKVQVAPPEHIEALRQHCAKTGRAVLGSWPRAPLVRHLPDPAPLGTKQQFQTDHVQFASYEGRLESDVHEMTIETISQSPQMLRIDSFLSDSECEYLMEAAASRLSPGGSGSDPASTWLEHGESPVVTAITRRVFDLMGFSPDIETFYFAEKLQVTRYSEGEEYLPHYDAMDLTTSQRDLPHNRYATVMMYLNSVSPLEGGQEVWPRANGADEFSRPPCQAALQLQPTRGTAIIMYSMLGDGLIDEAALHGSCPVLAHDKDKWTANMFFWDPFVQWPAQ